MVEIAGKFELSKIQASTLNDLIQAFSRLPEDSALGSFVPLRFRATEIDLSMIDPSNSMIVFCVLSSEEFVSYSLKNDIDLLVNARDFQKKLAELVSFMEDDSVIEITIGREPKSMALSVGYLQAHEISVMHETQLLHQIYTPKKPLEQAKSVDYISCGLTKEELADATRTLTVAGGVDARFLISDGSLTVTTKASTAMDRFASEHKLIGVTSDTSAKVSLEVSIGLIGIAQMFLAPFEEIELSIGPNLPLRISSGDSLASVEVLIAPVVMGS